MEQIKNPGDISQEELAFAVFCIESIAQKLKYSGDRIFSALAEKSDILDSYIIPSYDVLHTQGKDYIVEDILTLMTERGVEI